MIEIHWFLSAILNLYVILNPEISSAEIPLFVRKRL